MRTITRRIFPDGTQVSEIRTFPDAPEAPAREETEPREASTAP